MTVPTWIAASGSVSVLSSVPLQRGMVAINVDGDTWIPYNGTTASTYPGHQIGVVMTAIAVPGQNVAVQTDGLIPYDLFNLNGGAASYVGIGANFLPIRAALSPQTIGICDKSGLLIVLPSYVGAVFSGTGNQVAGTGLWHSTTGLLDPNALVGTEGQILFTNAAPDTQFLYPTNDISSSNTTPGKLTVVGFNSIPIQQGTNHFNQIWSLNTNTNKWVNSDVAGDLTPSGVTIGNFTVNAVQGFPWTSGNPGSGNVPQFNGTSWVFVAGTSLGTTWTAGGDLSGTVSAQYLRSISGNLNGGGQVPITSATWLGVNTSMNFIRNGSAVVLGIDASNNVIIGTNANSPNGLLASAQGSQTLQLQATGGTDFIAFGSGTAQSGYVRADNNRTIVASRTALGTADFPVIATDNTNTIIFGDTSHSGNLQFNLGTFGGTVMTMTTSPNNSIRTFLPIDFSSTGGTAISANAGTNGDVPAQVVGYIKVFVAGAGFFKIPYYAN